MGGGTFGGSTVGRQSRKLAAENREGGSSRNRSGCMEQEVEMMEALKERRNEGKSETC